ncbi:MAG: histidine kinase dimerization/phospho-acceptor domain-containing protein, partial [Pseudomonadota bacterium]
SAAHAAAERKEQLLAKLSHDVRTPVNAIAGFTQLLRTDLPGDLPEETRKYLDLVADNTAELAAMLDDLFGDTERADGPSSQPGATQAEDLKQA